MVAAVAGVSEGGERVCHPADFATTAVGGGGSFGGPSPACKG